MKRLLQDATVGVVLLALFSATYYATGKLGAALLRAVGFDVSPSIEPLVPALGATACYVVIGAGNLARVQWRERRK
ncbi:MAG: hypothetical protein ABL977_10775 [Candidatus Eisenbacteria bacterium]